MTLWLWPLTFWLWSVVVHGGSRGQPLHLVRRSYGCRSWVMSSDIPHRIPLTGEGRSLQARFQGEGVVPLPIYWYHSKDSWMLYNFAADSFYIMKLVIFTASPFLIYFYFVQILISDVTLGIMVLYLHRKTKKDRMWQHHEWSRVTLKITLAAWNLSKLHTSENTVCICDGMFTHELESVACTCNVKLCWNLRLRMLTAVTYTAQVAMPRKRCEKQTLLRQTTRHGRDVSAWPIE